MYKIINITDKPGNIKVEFMDELKKAHPNMSGILLYPLSSANRLCIIWTDNSEKMLRTSPIVSYTKEGKITTVVTENSIYTLERVK